MTVFTDWLAAHWEPVLRAVLILGLGLPFMRIVSRLVNRASAKRLSEQSGMLLGNAVTYAGSALVILMCLRELGFKLTAFLGAAGVVGVAVGFAAQTSLSNLISGLFLIAEKPFEVGDVIQIDNTTGIVHSIDLISLKLRTFDNRFIRIPNETLVKNQLTNITRFPIRRLDIDVGVAYKENVDHVIRVLNEVADRNPFCLDEPAPLIIFKGFGESALEFLFGVWFQKSDMLNLRNSIMREIKERFDAENIEIPFPHRSLYAGAATAPFPIRIVRGDEAPTAGGDVAT